MEEMQKDCMEQSLPLPQRRSSGHSGQMTLKQSASSARQKGLKHQISRVVY